MTKGACTVRSADASEPLTQWHPDLVLMDPSQDEIGGAAPNPQRPAELNASRVLVVSLSYEPGQATGLAPDRLAHPERIEQCHLASATIQSVEMKHPVLARYASRPGLEVPPSRVESRAAQDS